MNLTLEKLKEARDAGIPDDVIWETAASAEPKFNELKQNNIPLDVAFEAYQQFKPQGTSFTKEVGQLGSAFMESIGRPLENMGESFDVLGYKGVAEALKGAITEPENYESAAARFTEPNPEDTQFLGFAWQYAPRAIVEQTGQAIGSIATRAGGAALGAAAGSVAGPKGVAAGGLAGAFVGPAIFEAAQIIGPVAKERAMRNGREIPTNEDILGGTLTAIGSGALNAVGAKYLPGGEKATGKFFKRLASSFAGEGVTETGQAFVEQTGSSLATEEGLEINVKQAIGEGIIGGGTAAGITTITSPFVKSSEDQVIRTPEQAEEIDIDAKASEEAVKLMANPADQATDQSISRAKEIESFIANNEVLAQSLEPNDPEAKRLNLETKEAKTELNRIKNQIEESVGLTPLDSEQEISSRIENTKIQMAGLDPTSRKFKELESQLSNDEASLAALSEPIAEVERQQAELAQAIAAEPEAVTPTAQVAAQEAAQVTPPVEEAAPVSETITPVISEEVAQVSEVTPAPTIAEVAPVEPIAPAPVTEQAAPAEAPAPEVAPVEQPKIIAYRGDKDGIQEFQMNEGEGMESDFGKGPYFTSSERIATSYAAGADEAFAGIKVPKGKKVYKAEVDIKKPLWVWYGGFTQYEKMPQFFASKEFQALAEKVRATGDKSAIFNLERAIKENGFRNYNGATFALASPFGGWEKAKSVFKEVGFDGIAAQLGSDGDPSTQYIPFSQNQINIVKEPTPAVSETITPAPTPEAPAIAVGTRVKLGRVPKVYIVDEVLPRTEIEIANNEQSYSLRGETDGEITTSERKGINVVGAGTTGDKRFNPLGYDINDVVEDINQGKTDGPLRAVNKVIEESTALRERVKAESERRKQPRKMGKAAILERIARERSAGNINENTAKALTDFINRINEDAIWDTAISIRAKGVSNFDFGDNLVTFFLNQDKGGLGAAVGIHEFWHGLSRFLPDTEVQKINNDYTKELADYLKKNPWFLAFVGRYSLTPEQFEAYKFFNPKEAETKLTPVKDEQGNIVKYNIKFDKDNYRYIMLDEFIAEKMTDLVLQKQQAPDTFLGKLAKVLREFMDLIKARLGIDPYESFYQTVTSTNERLKLQRETGVAPAIQIYEPVEYDYSTRRMMSVEVEKQVTDAKKIEQVSDQAVSALGADVKSDFDSFINEGKTIEQIANQKNKSVNDVRVNIVKSRNAVKKALAKAKLKPLDAKPANPVVEWTTKSAKRYLTKEGDLPGGTFQKWVRRNARLSKEAEQVKQNVKKMYDALRKIYKINKIDYILNGLSSVPPEMVEKINEALGGKIDINTLPQELRKPITKMREHIDVMSTELIATGQLPDFLEAKTFNNLGTYLTRSYKIFSDPKWIQKIPAEKMTNARNFLYQQGAKNDPNFTLEDADRQLMQMLNDWAGEAESKDKRRGGKLGAKDLSVMMQRSDIPKELRDVMGENNNAIFNYANTVGKISRFIADQNFLDAVKQEGAGKFLYTKDAAPSGFNTLIATEDSRTMSPLNGLRTTPEIAEAFAEFGKSYDATQNPALYALGWLNAVGKANLTVGSVLTQMRNLIGQPFFFLANGHTNLGVINAEVNRLMKDMGLTKEEARQELVKMAAGEALINENAYAGELKEAFAQLGLKTFDDMDADTFSRQFVLLRLFKSGTRGAQNIYQKTDEFGKVIGWLNETNRVMRMNKGMSREEAMSIASERIRNTYPTYTQGSQALRLFRRQPFIGPFATFFYETFRTTYWNLKYAFDDINKGGAARKEGIARLAGSMAQLSIGAFAANAVSKMIAGIGDDEEEDVRRMLPPWEKDAAMIWFPKDKQGVYNYINLSYVSPYNAITDPFVAMMSGFARGEDPVSVFVEAAGSFLEPFVSEQPVTAAIMDVSRNKTETGRKVYNEEADLSTKTTDILLHVFGQAFTPGTVDRIRKRIVPAIYGETVGTRAPEPLKEIASELSGIRFQNLDMKQAFQNRAWEFSKSQNESERIFRDVATRRRRVTAEEQIKAYRTAEQSRFDNWQEMYRDYMAVRRAGATEDEAIELMTDIRISKREAYMIADGEYMPYQISKEVIRRSELNGNEVPLDEIDAIADSMPTTLQDLPKKP